jgi:hypothetical protein
MSIEDWIQYGTMGGSLIALAIGHKGMKPFIPVGMFASLYANAWCYLAVRFHWWDFPVRIVPAISEISIPSNMVVVPIMAMFWVRYSPMSRINWALLWTTILTGAEFLIERNTEVLEYHNGYEWYFSYVLWFGSWFVWYEFHKWFWEKKI